MLSRQKQGNPVATESVSGCRRAGLRPWEPSPEKEVRNNILIFVFLNFRAFVRSFFVYGGLTSIRKASS